MRDIRGPLPWAAGKPIGIKLGFPDPRCVHSISDGSIIFNSRITSKTIIFQLSNLDRNGIYLFRCVLDNKNIFERQLFSPNVLKDIKFDCNMKLEGTLSIQLIDMGSSALNPVYSAKIKTSAAACPANTQYYIHMPSFVFPLHNNAPIKTGCLMLGSMMGLSKRPIGMELLFPNPECIHSTGPDRILFNPEPRPKSIRFQARDLDDTRRYILRCALNDKDKFEREFLPSDGTVNYEFTFGEKLEGDLLTRIFDLYKGISKPVYSSLVRMNTIT